MFILAESPCFVLQTLFILAESPCFVLQNLFIITNSSYCWISVLFCRVLKLEPQSHLGWTKMDTSCFGETRTRYVVSVIDKPACHKVRSSCDIFSEFSCADFSRVAVFKGRKEMFYLTMHSAHFIKGYMVKDRTYSERENLLPPHGLLFPISSKGSFICIIPQTG